MVSYIKECRLGVFVNIILRRLSEAKMDENGESSGIHKDELSSLYRSAKIVWVIKSRRLRWTGHIARIEKAEQVNLQEGDLQEALGVDGRTIFEWVLKKWV